MKIDFTSLDSDMTCYTYLKYVKERCAKVFVISNLSKTQLDQKTAKLEKKRKNILTDMYVSNSMKTAV